MSKSADKRRPGGGKRATVGERRRRRSAAALGLTPTMKRHLDAMHEVALERFGVGIGVIVEQEVELKRAALSHLQEQARLSWHRRLWWPFGEWHRLGRMAREAFYRADEWERRLQMCALEVAAKLDEPVDADVARSAEER